MKFFCPNVDHKVTLRFCERQCQNTICQLIKYMTKFEKLFKNIIVVRSCQYPLAKPDTASKILKLLNLAETCETIVHKQRVPLPIREIKFRALQAPTKYTSNVDLNDRRAWHIFCKNNEINLPKFRKLYPEAYQMVRTLFQKRATQYLTLLKFKKLTYHYKKLLKSREQLILDLNLMLYNLIQKHPIVYRQIFESAIGHTVMETLNTMIAEIEAEKREKFEAANPHLSTIKVEDQEQEEDASCPPK